MGSGIATALLLSRYTVILKEVNERFLQSGIGRVKGTKIFLFRSQVHFIHFFVVLFIYLLCL